MEFECSSSACADDSSILKLAAGRTVRSKGPSRKRKEQIIKKIEDKFDAGDYYNLIEYLSAISRCRWVGF